MLSSPKRATMARPVADSGIDVVASLPDAGAAEPPWGAKYGVRERIERRCLLSIAAFGSELR